MSEYQSKSNTKENNKTSSESVSKETQTSFEDDDESTFST